MRWDAAGVVASSVVADRRAATSVPQCADF
jgi:hypothetical protein